MQGRHGIFPQPEWTLRKRLLIRHVGIHRALEVVVAGIPVRVGHSPLAGRQLVGIPGVPLVLSGRLGILTRQPHLQLSELEVLLRPLFQVVVEVL